MMCVLIDLGAGDCCACACHRTVDYYPSNLVMCVSIYSNAGSCCAFVYHRTMCHSPSILVMCASVCSDADNCCSLIPDLLLLIDVEGTAFLPLDELLLCVCAMGVRVHPTSMPSQLEQYRLLHHRPHLFDSSCPG